MLLTRRIDSGPMSHRLYEEVRPQWTDLSCHGGLELTWVRRGALTYRLGQAEVTVPPGAVVVVPEGVEHRAMMGSAAQAESIHLAPSAIAQLADALGPRVVLRALAPGVVHGSGIPRRASLGWGGSFLGAAALVAEGYVLDVLRSRLRDAQLAEVRDLRITRALELVWEGSEAVAGVDELARAAGMSRFHFSRQFRARIGRSPYQFLLQVRLARAAQLLKRGSPVTEAATTAGFTDLNRFGQAFRRQYRLMPRAYASAARH